jgi:outer membrane protein TolC
MAGVCLTVATAQEMPAPSRPATPLSALIQEAEQKNPEIQAAAYAFHAAERGAGAAGALPDMQIMVQQLNVGSPRPFAGYTNSDFAYIGLGASQELPWPGKRGLRKEVAGLAAKATEGEAEAVRRKAFADLKIVYFKLAYLQETFTILLRNDKLLAEMEQIAEGRYRVGKSNQQEVLKAQLQHTHILQEINMHHREQAEAQAQIKRLLGREQSSLDVVTEPIRERTLPSDRGELLRQAGEKNPEVAARKSQAERADKMVELSRKEFRPDFAVQYMYQNNDRKFRDYYMATFTVTLPNRSRRRAELAQALEEKKAADAAVDAARQRRVAEVQEQLSIAELSSEQLKIYREGLMPQAEATLRSAMAAYEAGRQDFETLISSFREVLELEEQYQKELSEHESALARLESLTGVTLP